ncbi:NADPH-dependent 2,4-dienoyl-CoA reductase/sulfur reductase-like enzyme [Arthrobacter globiformis]|uniref:NAD(P)/FAD-dependent oxidoreductase n=1 Tax=Arthrobacter globiformis TaxID=1665 RepID=UPI002786B137|nr:FAD-dependent oxidoreductase [Arthrobacter globiformis]MDQ1060529.1 NADPH-dependent 2,4-dienoyl-CoA reductase/sulfur reductase-like enzyme [Arthrobacter globiformis]
MKTLAIVGASLAGLSAARAARAQGFSGRLVIIGDEHHRPYDRPPLSKDFLLGTITAEDLFLETDDDGLNAEWLLGGGAIRLDSATRTIHLDDGRTVTADGIVIATGARARQIPALAGLDNVFYLRTMADAQGLTPMLVAGARMIVIGAGFIGAEVASAAASRGMEVTMINSGPVPFSAQLGQDMGSVVANLHEANGVNLICGTGIDEFHSTANSVTGLRLADGRELAADVVVVGIGAEPNVEWLAGSGVEVDGGVLCDAMGRTSVPGIVAVGDCAAWFDAAVDKHRRVEHWTGALERAALAVQALLDSDSPAQPLKPPYFWSDQHGVKIQFAGHSAGYDRVEIATGDPQEHNFLAVYYRGEDAVAVLGMNQPRLFTRWRRSLAAPALRSEAPGGRATATAP